MSDETAPEWFRDLMFEWLVKHGPDGHCDGYEIIADLAWHAARGGQPALPATSRI